MTREVLHLYTIVLQRKLPMKNIGVIWTKYKHLDVSLKVITLLCNFHSLNFKRLLSQIFKNVYLFQTLETI